MKNAKKIDPNKPDTRILPGPALKPTTVDLPTESEMIALLSSLYHGERVSSPASRAFAHDVMDLLNIRLSAKGERQMAAHDHKVKAFAKRRAQ